MSLPQAGYVIDCIAKEQVANQELGATILYHKAMGERMNIKRPRVKTITCPHCGATLQVSKTPQMFRCEECRCVRPPCDRCEIEAVCSLTKCRYDTGAYPEESVRVWKGGAK